MVQYLLILIGLFVLLQPLLQLILILFVHFKPMPNLKKRYGEKGWAVVTGGSDGIGFGFCEQLATQGFNICMISRNGEKIDKKIKELKEKINKDVDYMGIVANFKQCNQEKFFQKIFSQLQPLDISILVNNVGISELTQLKDQSYQSIFDLVNVNCTPMAIFTSFLSKKIQARKQRCGIVNVSSYSFVEFLPYMNVYAATKAFNDSFSQSCSNEDSKNDYLSVRAMKVLSQVVKGQKSLTVCSSRECARSCLKWLGIKKVACGHIKHDFVRTLIELLPKFIVSIIAKNECRKILEGFSKKS